MLKTYRIIPLVFILFLFGFTLFTESPVFAQTVDQLIERIEKLEAAVFPVGETAASGSTQPSSLTTHPSRSTKGIDIPSICMGCQVEKYEGRKETTKSSLVVVLISI